MIEISNEQFEELIAEAIDALPKKYKSRMQNVAILWEEEPSNEMRTRLQLGPGSSLYGLYEGVPLTQRGGQWDSGLPDKITLFKLPLQAKSSSLHELKEEIRHTLWHEVAHYFGLDHDQINKRDGGRH